MDVKICDRCGKTIAATTVQKIGVVAWRYNLIDRNRGWRTSYECDLCSDCGKKLMKFVNGAEIKEE